MSDETPQTPNAPKLTLTSEIGLGHYSNFVSIAHNFSEVLLDFGRTLPGREDIPDGRQTGRGCARGEPRQDEDHRHDGPPDVYSAGHA